jgi:hypothetical protein
MNKLNISSKKIFKNAIITYINGEKKIFDAIAVTDKGIYTGIIKVDKDNCEEFIDDGLISKEEIKKIIILDNSGDSQKINLKF